MADDSIDVRLARIEERLDTLILTATKDAEARDRMWQAIDPLIHSDPPIPARLRAIEDAQLEARTRDRVWRGIATIVSPLVTALLVAYLTGQIG